MLPHSLLFGHLPVVTKLLRQLPSDAHPVYMPDQIRHHYPDLGPNYYVDLAPFAPSMLVIGTPEAHYQIAQEHLLKKMPNLKQFISPLTNGLDILIMEGAVWKKWRAVFNPGFSAAHLMTLVPAIVKETETYCKILDEHVEKNEIFAMKHLTDYLTLDVIGRVVLGTHFDCQRTPNQMVRSLRILIRWLSFGVEPNLLDRYNPWRYVMHWYHAGIVDAYISEELEKRLALQRDGLNNESDVKQTQTIMDLAIRAYTEIKAGESSPQDPAAMDPFFRQICMSQIKLFLFSGHDTTSSATCYHLYLLSKHPAFLARVQHEHQGVFGSDPTQAASRIAESPHLLNQLPLTTALIKESLRLFPVLSISRRGEPGFSIIDSQRRAFPTENFLVFANTHSIHHNPAYWPDPESFIPERWLVGPDDPLYPVKGAWRGFEHGPRACIGQELSMLEMKIILVLVARQYVFKPAYEELDRLAGKDKPTVNGERAYQVNIFQPWGDLPLRVEKGEGTKLQIA